MAKTSEPRSDGRITDKDKIRKIASQSLGEKRSEIGLGMWIY